MKTFTLGHSSLELDDLIQVLKEAGIDWIADVRSSPYSGRFPHFNRQSLSSALKKHGIKYLYMGDRLGGKPPAHEASAWTQGRLDSFVVSHLSESPRWQEGLKELTDIIKKMDQVMEVGCLLCSEADPNNCHRSAVAFELQQNLPSLEVMHLKPHGYPIDDVRFQKTLFRVSDDESHYH